MQNTSGMLIPLAHLPLFLIRHGQNTQGENFVDLRSIKELAGAFLGDLRKVVQNDRRGEHGDWLAFLFLADENRPSANVRAGFARFDVSWWRIHQGKKLASS